MSFKVLRFPETRKTQKTLETLKPNGQFADADHSKGNSPIDHAGSSVDDQTWKMLYKAKHVDALPRKYGPYSRLGWTLKHWVHRRCSDKVQFNSLNTPSTYHVYTPMGSIWWPWARRKSSSTSSRPEISYKALRLAIEQSLSLAFDLR